MTTADRLDISPDEVLEDSSLNESLDVIATRLWRRAVRSGTWDPAQIDFTEDRQHFAALDENLRLYLEAFAAAFFNAESHRGWSATTPPAARTIPATWPRPRRAGASAGR